MAANTTFDPTIRRELSRGERLLWTGRPKQGFVLRRPDLLIMPLGLVWAGFYLSEMFRGWATGGSVRYLSMDVAFILLALYVTAGRLVVSAWLRGGTRYAVTNKRALIVTDRVWHRVKSINLRSSEDIMLAPNADSSGTIYFGSSMAHKFGYLPIGPSIESWYIDMPPYDDLPPRFQLIPDVRRVYDLIMQVKQAR